MAALLVIALVLKYAEEKEESVQQLRTPSADLLDSFYAFFNPYTTHIPIYRKVGLLNSETEASISPPANTPFSTHRGLSLGIPPGD